MGRPNLSQRQIAADRSIDLDGYGFNVNLLMYEIGEQARPFPEEIMVSLILIYCVAYPDIRDRWAGQTCRSGQTAADRSIDLDGHGFNVNLLTYDIG